MCTAVQSIWIYRLSNHYPELSLSDHLLIKVDGGSTLDSTDVERLAKNDGLTIEEFINYFTPKPGDVFEGKIIHWTNVRY